MLKLGKLKTRQDSRTLKLAKYLTSLPKNPKALSWYNRVSSWPMMLNDEIGDCTIAAAGHLLQEWSDNNIIIPDKTISSVYSAISGYDPKTGANDNGCVELDVLNFWRKNGIGGHKIGAYVSIDPTKHDLVKTAMYLFGGVYLGLSLPISAQKEVGKIWRVGGAAGGWGGHAVFCGEYDSLHINCITWGELQKMSWGFLNKYCDECYAILSPDWFLNNIAPNNFNLVDLQNDLNAI